VICQVAVRWISPTLHLVAFWGAVSADSIWMTIRDGRQPENARNIVKNWIYFATSEKASLASTIETGINAQFLWRPAFNEKGARIANVGGIQDGDHVVVAWRQSSATRTAYLECTVAEQLSPATPGLVIDKLAGPVAQILISAGYPQNSAAEVEGIRLDDIRECYFQVQGEYGGDNAIHKLAVEDVGHLSKATTIPLKRSLKMAI
jgi:hypothetical protein